ncbi:uncharacterized protein PV09_08841 [Verruconis gallopava]|uniref:Uncharacterized protein n=1 Tax=Verruconis gallopava TaxID=253628 RepID=A0A0D1YFN5_9PEZI|nr:uncharacterized protein PV09_08841 [Verruconis gallopava]KIV99541.1 hypothetical protein PV09_08841 [Verruconis gallopava]
MYCQECRTPLRLDSSLNELNPAAFKLLAESTGSTIAKDKNSTQHGRPPFSAERREEYDRVSKKAKQPVFRRTVGSSRQASARSSNSMSKDTPDMSFIMLTDSQMFPSNETSAHQKSVSARRRGSHPAVNQQGDEDSISSRMETANRLFEILSARADIDHPICVECTERLVDQLQKRLGNVTRERDAYVEFLRQANADVPTDEELQQARQELKRIQAQERAAFAELEELEKEKAAMEAEILDLEAQARELDIQEEKFWAERNEFSQKLTALQNERDRLNNQYDHDSKQLERLRRANVYNDTFSIGHDGFFGTINGLRLGRLPERPVDWSEINAAWGHTCLLLVTVAEKLNYTFKGYELLPMGSTSRIKQYKTPRSASNDPSHLTKPRADIYKLYHQGDAISTLGGLFHSEFDSAMIAFLECLRQLIDHAHRTPIELSDGGVVECPRIAYRIEKDKIGDHSIRLSGLGNQEAEWTKACKLTLICCKFLLAHASNASDIRRNR